MALVPAHAFAAAATCHHHHPPPPQPQHHPPSNAPTPCPSEAEARHQH